MTQDTESSKPSHDLQKLYRVMNKRENICGGEGFEGIYGTITLTGMWKIFTALKNHCDFSDESSLVDIGAGLGRPLLHALVDPGVKGAVGFEVDELKWMKAGPFMEGTMKEIGRGGGPLPIVECLSIEQVKSLNPFTHGFSFWEGIPHSAKKAFGRLFLKSKTMKAVAVVQPSFRKRNPAVEMRKLGFGPVELKAEVIVKMSGSGSSFRAYVFEKRDYIPPTVVLEQLPTVKLDIGKVKELSPVANRTRSKLKIDWAERRDVGKSSQWQA